MNWALTLTAPGEYSMKESTKLINSNNFQNEVSGKVVQTVNPPVYRGSTVLFEKYEDFVLANSGMYDGVTYGTDGLPTQRLLEEEIRKLEGGYLTKSFQSGISAITATMLAFTNAGDHILVCDNIYGPTRRFCEKVLTKYNIQTDYVPASVGKDIGQFIKPNTRLIFLESPGSNTFEIQDISAITTIAKEKEIVTVLDNTWATPIFLNPFELGIDVSIQSLTKYISGHSDVLLGTATVNEKYAAIFKEFYHVMELFTAQDDCYLALRGLKTLPIRLKQHEKSAFEIATWIETLSIVDNVLHPALSSHPEHAIWQRDFSGASGLFGFTFKEDYSSDKIASFIDSLSLFGIGYSWGGFKSLITAGKYKRSTKSRYAGKLIIRLNIGLEDIKDLQADLEKSLSILSSR
jgi:cystathionine beta-lyase